MCAFLNMLALEELFDPRRTTKLEDHPFSYARTAYSYIRSYPRYLNAVSSIRDIRTRRALVTCSSASVRCVCDVFWSSLSCL
jgi:hypothetical protein